MANPPAFASVSRNSVSPHMSLAPPKLLTFHWNPRQVSESERVCVQPLFRGMSVFLSSFCLTQNHSQILWGLFFLGLEPRTGEPLCGSRDPHSFLQGGFCSHTLPLSISHHTRIWDQPILCLCSSSWSQCGFFSIPLDVCDMIS